MIDIAFINETEQNVEGYNELITSVFEKALEIEKIDDPEIEVSVIYVTNDKIKEINQTYRNKDSVTDVISFALEDDSDGEIAFINEAQTRMLGDIFICIDRANEQAVNYGHSIRREMAFLALHGLLHLLGYDHIELEDEVIMTEKQELILSEIGIKREK